MEKAMFAQELEYFITHQEELVGQYQGKILVLRNQSVVGVYDSMGDAYFEAQKQFPLGTFMLQQCIPGPDAYTVTISSLNLSI